MQAGRAAVMLRTQRNNKKIARPLSHALPRPDVMQLRRCGAKIQMSAQNATNAGNGIHVALLRDGAHSLKPSKM